MHNQIVFQCVNSYMKNINVKIEYSSGSQSFIQSVIVLTLKYHWDYAPPQHSTALLKCERTEVTFSYAHLWI